MEFNNRGILFKNFRKKQPKHPDVIGEATIDGRKFKLAGWIKQGRRGEFHSLAFTQETPPEQHDDSTSSTETAEAPLNNDNDIPF